MAVSVINENSVIEPILPEIKQDVKEEEPQQTVEEPKKPTRSRRPNRNTQRKSRTPKKSVKQDEE